MKRIYSILLFFVCSITAIAQIPYFASTVGNNKLYGYTSLKFRPGINAQETYTTFQYGVGSSFATGVDITTGNASTFAGVLLRYGLPINQWFNIGFQATPSFNMNDNMSFSYLTAAMYLNGAITTDNKLFWAGNTWWGINRNSKNTITQYLYLGYNILLKNQMSLTPMLGTIYSWEFNNDADIAFGAYWSIKSYNIYLWGNDFLKSHPRIIIGVDFTF